MCLGLCPGWGTQLNEGTQPGRGNPRIWNWISGVCDTGLMHLCPSLAATGEDAAASPVGKAAAQVKAAVGAQTIGLTSWYGWCLKPRETQATLRGRSHSRRKVIFPGSVNGQAITAGSGVLVPARKPTG